MKKTQPSATEATAVKAFLNWIVTSGDTPTYVSTVGFLPMPAAAKTIATTLVNSISG